MNLSPLSFSYARQARRGFSMIELMTVVAIMILLAGILLASLPGIKTKINRNNVERFLAELEAGLGKYKLEYGSYPLNAPAGSSQSQRESAGVTGAEILYKELSGDRNLNGTVDFSEDGYDPTDYDSSSVAYVPKLSFAENEDSQDARSIQIGGRYMVVDPYGDPIRYLAQPPNIPVEDRVTFNPTYDIWSIAGSDPTSSASQAAHITNWQSN